VWIEAIHIMGLTYRGWLLFDDLEDAAAELGVAPSDFTYADDL